MHPGLLLEHDSSCVFSVPHWLILSRQQYQALPLPGLHSSGGRTICRWVGERVSVAVIKWCMGCKILNSGCRSIFGQVSE